MRILKILGIVSAVLLAVVIAFTVILRFSMYSCVRIRFRSYIVIHLIVFVNHNFEIFSKIFANLFDMRDFFAKILFFLHFPS